jgi:hypothetical protein
VGLTGRRLGAGLCRALTAQAHDKQFSLPCVSVKTHGKEIFAVRFFIGRTANNFFNNFIKFIKNIK